VKAIDRDGSDHDRRRPVRRDVFTDCALAFTSG
jgi:hypothetical protein